MCHMSHVTFTNLEQADPTGILTGHRSHKPRGRSNRVTANAPENHQSQWHRFPLPKLHNSAHLQYNCVARALSSTRTFLLRDIVLTYISDPKL